jgi:hypothetical protein
MPFILDPSAPNQRAEYSRYIDGDLLGKIITRNFLVNRCGFSLGSIYTPIGRYGDASKLYATPGSVIHDMGDGYVDVETGRVTFEVKCARINIANRSLGHTLENWAFVNVLHSPGKAPKTYDVLIAVGLHTLGLEDDKYWQHLQKCQDMLRDGGYASRIDALPHEPEYLSLCSFFIVPRSKLQTNYFRVNLGTVSKNQYGAYHARGYDQTRCREIWDNAVSDKMIERGET